MKIPRIIRPEIEIKFKGFLGFVHAVYAIIRVGIKRVKITLEIKGVGDYPQKTIYVIPKYKMKRWVGD